MAARWLVVLLAVSVVVAQEEPPAEPAPPERPPAEPAPADRGAEFDALLARAVAGLRAAENLVARGSVRQEEAEPPQGPGGRGMGGQVVIRMGGVLQEDAEPFAGDLEVWRDPDNVTVILSQAALPGFGIYVDANRTIKQTTFEEERVSLRELERELVPMLEGDRLARAIEAASLRARFDPATGSVHYTGELSKKLVNEAAGVAMGMQAMLPKVLRVDGTLVVSEEGRLEKLELRVVHNDPVAAMMQGRGLRVVVPGGQAPPPQQGQPPAEVVGKTSVYALALGDERPSMRARLFKESLQVLLESEQR